MYARDDVITGNEFDTAEELEEFLVDVFDELASNYIDRQGHDQDAFFCELAGSAECLALGHKPDADGDWYDDDLHRNGWDGDTICPETRWGSACSLCEGDCDVQNDMITRAQFWALFATSEPKDSTEGASE